MSTPFCEKGRSSQNFQKTKYQKAGTSTVLLIENPLKNLMLQPWIISFQPNVRRAPLLTAHYYSSDPKAQEKQK